MDFGSFDILSDEQVRAGLKVYSNWPTFPQVMPKVFVRFVFIFVFAFSLVAGPLS